MKLLASGETEPRKFASGGKLTPARMVEKAKEVAKGWRYDVNFAAAFGCPVRMTNDASMQALGSYDGGRMLFIGLGSGGFRLWGIDEFETQHDSNGTRAAVPEPAEGEWRVV